VKRRARAVAVKGVETPFRWNNVDQPWSILVPEDFSYLFKTIIDFPTRPLAPDNLITVTDDAICVDLIPG